MLELLLTDGQDPNIDGAELCELKQISLMIPSDTMQPREVLQYLKEIRATDLRPNLWLALRILLNLPVSVASGVSLSSNSSRHTCGQQ